MVKRKVTEDASLARELKAAAYRISSAEPVGILPVATALPPSAVAPPTSAVAASPGAVRSRPVVDDDAKLARTVYVGNVPADATRKAIKRHFVTYGAVESVRLRSASAANPKMSQRAAVITGELAGDAVCAYVVFEDAACAKKAIEATGAVAFERHLRISAAARPGESSAAAAKHDASRCVFLGNLPFDIAEETLWTLFERCGPVQYVRLVREQRTQQGKGFGYVCFVDAGSVERALELHGTRIASAPSEDGKPTGGRDVRVFRCNTGKSHQRHATQLLGGTVSGAPTGKGGAKGGEGGDVGGGGHEEGAGADATAAGESRPRVGWMDRERRRAAKKLAGKAAKALKGGSQGAGLSKTIVKKQVGGAKGSAKARAEAKMRAMTKRAQSKLKKVRRNDDGGGKSGGGK